MNRDILLSVANLRKWFELRKGIFGRSSYLKAVENVSFELAKGEAVSLVGESGSGKTTLGKTILGLYRPTNGKIVFDGKELWAPRSNGLLHYHQETGLVQQDPFGALPPFMSVQGILNEPLAVHGIKNSSERKERIRKALEDVRLTPVEDFIDKYPHMLSGGQQQRVVIARAMILNPKMIIADEPVSMLDASVRIEVLSLLKDLQERYDLSVVYITHDLSTTRYFSEWIFIMYAGKIVEKAKTRELLGNSLHPYSQALLKTIPDPDPDNRLRLRDIPPGEPPNLVDPPKGCNFHPRCVYAMADLCNKEDPPDVEVEDDHFAKCWLYG